MKELEGLIREELKANGTFLLGVTPVEPATGAKAYLRWLENRNHAGMHFLEKNIDCRLNPAKILKGSSSIISFALPYGQGDSLVKRGSFEGRIAQYGRLRDYHREMKKIGERVGRAIQSYCLDRGMKSPLFRVTVDSAPVLEREIAVKTIGFIGKNTCYIHPQWGSFLLLGEIFTTFDWRQDRSNKGNKNSKNDKELMVSKDGISRRVSSDRPCGSCKRCAVFCPTGALDTAYQLDANRCLSYWTIEHRGLIPVRFWNRIADYYFGCDICQIVCPFNRDRPKLSRTDLIRLDRNIDAEKVVMMTQEDYEKWFGGTPLTRARIHGLKRNALISLIVQKNNQLDRLITKLSSEPEVHQILIGTIKQIPEFNTYLNDHH